MTLYKAAALLAVCLPCAAETLRGRLLDASHAPIEGASVRTSRAAAHSNSLGEFSLPFESRNYSLTITKDGFLPLHVRGVARQMNLELVMEVEPVHNSVTVAESSGGYNVAVTTSATKTPTLTRDVPQSIQIVYRSQMDDQRLSSVGDAVRYTPGVTAIQGENNRDQLVIRGQSTSADFFLDGVRDDVQYFRDLYNLESLEVLKGSNAMAFGRGGGGGVVNRVTKRPTFTRAGSLTIDGGQYADRRLAGDFDTPVGSNAGLRLNAVYENSGSFRRFVNLERYGFAPAFTINLTPRASLGLAYELFHDGRTADRGIPSYRGQPVSLAPGQYFGDPNRSGVRFTGHLGSVTFQRRWNAVEVTSRLLAADYDRFYQNFVPGAVSADATQDLLSAYNNATHRRSVFNQTDVLVHKRTGRFRHTVVAGAELGRQATENFRNTGYFGNTATTLPIPLSDSVISAPVQFRQSATDANNHLLARAAATYVQDQISLSSALQIVLGVRLEAFGLQYHDNRTLTQLNRTDRVASPRAGIVFRPISAVSLYGSYSVSFLPSSGDQFSALTTITQQVQPERFRNLEVGAKWEVHRNLSLTAALFRLDRTNTRSIDPNDATRIVQTGSQRTNGGEVAWTGSVTRKWTVAGGLGFQDAFVVSATAAAQAGAHVAQTPRATFSLWNKFELTRSLGAGLGILNRSAMFAGIDNSVTLPGYTRADLALFFRFSERVRLQANLENLFDRRYFLNADNNNNISPGSPRALRVGLTYRF